MQLLICRKFNKSIILRILLYQIFVVLLALKLLSNYLIVSKVLRYIIYCFFNLLSQFDKFFR